jgi:hypothetical protein
MLSCHWLSKNIRLKYIVLYGCEMWSLTLREELGLRVSETKVLRKIFGHTMKEQTGGR